MVMEIIGLEAYDNGCGELKKKLPFGWTFFRITHQFLTHFSRFFSLYKTNQKSIFILLTLLVNYDCQLC
jgi:hypothetical protein